MPKVLLVEDDRKLSKYIKKGLMEAGYVTDVATDGNEALTLVRGSRYDVIIVDIMLPGIDGLSLISRIRENNIKTPILILSARRSIDDKVRGLNIGGDDYMTKPFSFSELLARINALMRRNPVYQETKILRAADLTVDLDSMTVKRGNKTIQLLPREFSILVYLLRNKGRVVSRETIMDNVWGYDYEPSPNAVNIHICRLREKIDKGFNKKLIHTIRGVGYTIRDE